MNGRFPIPSSIQDLERAPYDLLPYPETFNEDDRDDSFAALVHELEQGNRTLRNADWTIFETNAAIGAMQENGRGPPLEGMDQGDEDGVWLDEERLQALYTLVRKSTSLEQATRQALAKALTEAIYSLIRLLESAHDTIPPLFRDAWAAHVYFLYQFMFFLESELKASSKVPEILIATRQLTADAMKAAAQAMSRYRDVLWQRGVPEEAIVALPTRIAFPLLEIATGVLARKAACADQALQIIAVTVQGAESLLLNMVTAALMDLMHSFEHVAALAAELCTITADDTLGTELLREVARLESTSDPKSGIRFVAPFVALLAQVRPKLVWQHIAQLLPHLQSEPYNLRSAIVTAVGHILESLHRQEQTPSAEDNAVSDNTKDAIRKSKHALWDVLAERVYDISSYTRSAVLKVWIQLVQSHCLPKERHLIATRMAMDRVQDKTVIVRKQALQLLTCLLENNPFMANLDPHPFQNKLRELYEFVRENMPESIRNAQDTVCSEADMDDSDTDMKNKLQKEVELAALAAAMAEADTMLENPDHLSSTEQEFCTKVQALRFTQSALDFIEIFEEATVALESMLLSSNTSDVTEALRLFVKARHFGLPCAFTGMKRALSLLWSSEASIRDEVLKAFVQVFLEQPGTDRYLPNEDIAKNLLVLVNEATLSEIASIEEAILRLVREEKLPADVFMILWTVASNDNSHGARAAAFQLLSMGAKADRSIIDSKSRLKSVLDAGLSDDAQERQDWKLVRAACQVLRHMTRAQVDPTDAKYLILERIMEQLCVVAQGEWCKDTVTAESLAWFSGAEQAIKALFVICPEPETACRSVIVAMHQTTFVESQCHSMRLARFFFILGETALNLLVYTEAISGSLRRANAKRTLLKQQEVAKDSGDIEDELGMVQAAEAENERKLVDISENEILGRGLIHVFGPLLVRVVANEGGRYQSDILMQAAVLALCKFMCVSSQYCEKHLPLLFTAFANAPAEDTVLRANTVVALGDLAFRFPNEVEPYTARLYACLRDSSTKVRRHTLMVLTHLILNDMVKVKGQVCEIAMCLRDNDPRIRDMSRLLFHELSKRSHNPIYNLLPDIISQLSQLSIRREDFRSIMSFLLGYITKDRQNEMLTEKLCLRFPKCQTLIEKADMAYCIAQLKITERCVKFLSENFKLYKDALVDEDARRSFASIATKAKKVIKPEMRQLVDEWESNLSEIATAEAENQAAGENAAKAKTKVRRKANRKKKPLAVADNEDDDACVE